MHDFIYQALAGALAQSDVIEAPQMSFGFPHHPAEPENESAADEAVDAVPESVYPGDESIAGLSLVSKWHDGEAASRRCRKLCLSHSWRKTESVVKPESRPSSSGRGGAEYQPTQRPLNSKSKLIQELQTPDFDAFFSRNIPRVESLSKHRPLMRRHELGKGGRGVEQTVRADGQQIRRVFYCLWPAGGRYRLPRSAQ